MPLAFFVGAVLPLLLGTYIRNLGLNVTNTTSF